MSQILSNSKKTLARQILSILIQLVSVVIIARELGVEGNGHYAMVILLPAFMSMILSLGINSSNIYFVGKKEYPLSVIYTTSLILTFIIVFFGLLFGYVSLYFYSQSLFPNIDLNLLLLSLYIFPFAFIYSVQVSFLLAKENFSAYNLVSLSGPTIFIIFIFILSYFNNITIETIIISSLIRFLISLIIATLYVQHNGYKFMFKSFSKKYMHKSLSYGLRSHVSDIIAFVNYRADMFLLNLLSTLGAVGIYYIAVQIIERLWIISSVMSTVLLPRFVALNNDIEKRIELISKAFRIVLLLTLFAAILLVICGYYFIGILFGDQYLDGYYAILFLIPGVVLGAGSRIVANAIAAKGRPELNMYTSIFAMLLNIILNIVLIPYYGYIGAAIATSVAYTLNTILRIWLFSRLEKTFHLKNLILRSNDVRYIFKVIMNRKKNI